MSNRTPRVRIHTPPGDRACGGAGGEWLVARDSQGAAPYLDDLRRLTDRMPSDESRSGVKASIHELMKMAEQGHLPWELVDQMQCAPDVLEIRLPDWTFTGGKMLTRVYFSEPYDLPANLVLLRIRFKRPGPFGLTQQDEHAREASQLLTDFEKRGFV